MGFRDVTKAAANSINADNASSACDLGRFWTGPGLSQPLYKLLKTAPVGLASLGMLHGLQLPLGKVLSFLPGLCFLTQSLQNIPAQMHCIFLPYFTNFQVIRYFFTLDSVPFQLRHEELICLLKIPFLLLESSLQ